jgi:hypothetical protein
MRYLIISKSLGLFLGGQRVNEGFAVVFANNDMSGYTNAISFEDIFVATSVVADISEKLSDCYVVPINVDEKMTYIPYEILASKGFSKNTGNMLLYVKSPSKFVH